MHTAHRIRPRFPTGPDTVLDVPLDGPMSATLVQDRSQNANHATLQNSPVFQYPGLLCDQTAESMAYADLLTTITIPATLIQWANVPAAGNSELLFLGQAATQIPYYKLKVQIGATQKPRAKYQDAGGDEFTAAHPVGGFADGKWHHYAAVLYLDGTIKVRLYVGGSLVISDDIDDGVAIDDNTATFDRYTLAGRPDNLAVSKTHSAGDSIIELRELSDAEIKSHYMLTRHKYNA